MYHFIDIQSDNSENVKYDSEYPIYIRKSPLSIFLNYSAQSHWHDEIEFIYIVSGEMEYNINGKIVIIKENDGLFVNSHQLHYGFSSKFKDCEFICILIHPMFLCSQPSYENDFIAPIVNDPRFPYALLSKHTVWQKQICDYLLQMYSCKGESNWELKVQGLFSLIWYLLLNNKPRADDFNLKTDRNLLIFKKMLYFIQCHFNEKISLLQIAKSGGVGQSKCCELFNRYIAATPVNYITEYRISKSMDLLRNTDMSVTEIAFSVGFAGSSYFSETFKCRTGISPTKYRKNASSEKQCKNNY